MEGLVTEQPSDGSNKLFLPDTVMQSFGCRDCVWRRFGQCPEGFTKLGDKLAAGYCMDLANFIMSLSHPGDSISAIKEKFFIYTQEVQALADGTDYHKLSMEITSLRDKEFTMPAEEYKRKLAKLEMEMLSSKIWWSRLTEMVVKSLSRIADRESRSKDVKETKTLNVRELNVILQDSARVLLEDKEGKSL